MSTDSSDSLSQRETCIYMFQLLHSPPRRRPPAIRPAWQVVSSSTAARCPEASSSARQRAPAHAQPLSTAPTGHQADAARRRIRRCRPVPRGTKQRMPGSTSSCQAVPGGASRPSGRRSAPLHQALPPVPRGTKPRTLGSTSSCTVVRDCASQP